MVTIRNVVQIMGFRVHIKEDDKINPPIGQPITVDLHFKDESIMAYCEYHTTDIMWLTCNALWYLVAGAIMVETKPKQIYKAYDAKYKIDHYKFCKLKADNLKKLVGEEIYNYLVSNVDVTKKYG